MTVVRSAFNPVLEARHVAPSSESMRVVGAFNPAVARVGDEWILLVRVAEAPAQSSPDEVVAPVLDDRTGEIGVHRFRRDDPGVDCSDPRVIVAGGQTWLTSISHLRIARSSDRTHFEVEPEVALGPAGPLETFGVEDPRLTRIEDRWLVTYSAVSPHGIATALAETRDFAHFERRGIIFPPNNRNVAIFPERIGGSFVALHRPMPSGLGWTGIWLARSSDLARWGNYVPVAGPRAGHWDDAKIGSGAVPFRVHARGRDAWLLLYHGVSTGSEVYSIGAMLLDGADPAIVLGRSPVPLFAPEAAYERAGFLGNVVFTCGATVDHDPAGEDDLVHIYYGAADGVTALAEVQVGAILDHLR